GLGNTFVIVFDAVLDADEARDICGRNDNADGVIAATPGADGDDLTMILRNLDGSRAEVSGNGLACLGRAAVDAGRAATTDVVIETDAGRRVVRVRADAATVDMGEPVIKEADDGALFIDVGNPHLVFSTGDVVALGH